MAALPGKSNERSSYRLSYNVQRKDKPSERAATAANEELNKQSESTRANVLTGQLLDSRLALSVRLTSD